MIEKEIKITVDTKGAKKNLNDLEDSFDKTGEAAKGTQSQISTLTGSAGAKFSGLIKSIKSVALGFKSLKFAIAASGIGLVLITIAAISAAFKGSEEGQNKFAKLMGVIGSVTGNLVDVLADFGDFVINLFSGSGEAMTQLKNFGKSIYNVLGLPLKNVIDTVKALGNVLGALFSGDISGAFDALQKGVDDVKENFTEAKAEIDAATQSVKDFGNQIVKEGKDAAKVADQRAKADKIERDLIVDKAKAEREIAELRLKAKDLNNVSAVEREKALKKVLEIQDDLISRETEVLELRRDAIIAENGFARSNKENLDAEEQAKAAVIAAETRRTDQKRAIQRELTAAENEQNANRRAIAKEEEARRVEEEKAEKARLKAISDFKNELIKKNEDLEAETLEQKLELERTRAEEALDRLIGTETEKREALLELNNFYDEKEKDLAEQRRLEKKEQDEADLKAYREKQEAQQKIDDEKAKEKKELEEDVKKVKLNIASNTSALLAQLAEEDSEIGKGLALGAATISGYEGVQNAFTTANKSPITATFPAYPFIQAGLAGAFSALQIKNILGVDPKTGAGSSGGGASGGAPPPAPSFNLVEGTESNQIANSIQGQDQPIRAFVVAGDITTAQQADRNIIEGSSI